MLNFNKFQVLTFDCYGTLIDWETGILNALRPIFLKYGININDNEILKNYAEFESEIEKGPYIKYKEVLKKVLKKFGEKFKFSLSKEELNCLVDSLKHWPPFPDTVSALKKLKEKYKLAIISNIDRDLFAFTQKQLKVEFDWIITSEDIKAYKPSLENFKYAIKEINVPKEKILHIAQSIYHDINPAKKLGLTTILIKRRGFGATPSVFGYPDIEVPDLKTLVSLIFS